MSCSRQSLLIDWKRLRAGGCLGAEDGKDTKLRNCIEEADQMGFAQAPVAAAVVPLSSLDCILPGEKGNARSFG